MYQSTTYWPDWSFWPFLIFTHKKAEMYPCQSVWDQTSLKQIEIKLFILACLILTCWISIRHTLHTLSFPHFTTLQQVTVLGSLVHESVCTVYYIVMWMTCSASRSSTLTVAFWKPSCLLCKVVHSGVMVWFAHVADGAELKSWLSKEPVLGVNASLTYSSWWLLNYFSSRAAAAQHQHTLDALLRLHNEPSHLEDISRISLFVVLSQWWVSCNNIKHETPTNINQGLYGEDEEICECVWMT